MVLIDRSQKKRSGGGGGGQQNKAAEEGEENAPAAPNAGDASPAAEGNKDKEHDKGKDSDKEKDQQEKGKGKGKDKDKDGGTKKPPPVVTAVLKVDMHCDGCAKRIHGSVHRYPGSKQRNAITQAVRPFLFVYVAGATPSGAWWNGTERNVR